jgi:hypothetical protein
MNAFQRRVRARVIQGLRDTSRAPANDDVASALGSSPAAVRAALHALADEHRLALLPGTDSVWMAHPFSAVPTDFVVRSGGRTWWANCVWDGLSILGHVGDGWLETHSPQSGDTIRLTVEGGRVGGDSIVHFLVPARRFWDDIGFT